MATQDPRFLLTELIDTLHYRGVVEHVTEKLVSSRATSQLQNKKNQARSVGVSLKMRDIIEAKSVSRRIAMGSKMKIPEHVRTTITQDGAVLMNIKGGHMVTLNPIGSIIWQQLSDGHSREQIAAHLASEFGISQEQASSDVNEFLEQLEAQRLIESAESAGSRMRLGQKPTGLLCNLFGRRNSQTVKERGSK